jgi:hypothetical protein
MTWALTEHQPGERLAGVEIVARSVSSRTGANWRVRLPCGHEQIEPGGALRYRHKAGDPVRCQLCDWKGTDRRLAVLVAIATGVQPDIDGVARTTGLGILTVQACVSWLIRASLITHPAHLVVTPAGEQAIRVVLPDQAQGAPTRPAPALSRPVDRTEQPAECVHAGGLQGGPAARFEGAGRRPDQVDPGLARELLDGEHAGRIPE